MIIGGGTKKSVEKIYVCEVPFQISSFISLEKLNPLKPVIATLDLVMGNHTLLSEVEIYRVDKYDRRSFNTSICTMVIDIYDKRINEWIVYNILSGVEHFYIFDNNKRAHHSQSYISKSPIRPFLDANIVTLINYQYSMPEGLHWGLIQRASFQVFLQKYGLYSHWVGFFDIDEFFVPSQGFWPGTFSKNLEVCLS